MRFGLQIPTATRNTQGNDWDTMLAIAKLAEEVGFESIWYEDHFMFRDEQNPDLVLPELECMMSLAALAASTTRAQLGMLVLGTPYRNPALVAKMLTTLDVISHGRCIAGLGAGCHEDEFKAYGWRFPSLKERFEMLEDGVQIIDHMLRDRQASYQGKHFHIKDALNDPQPEQRPRPPIMIAGNGERKTLRLVAQYADMCNIFGSVEECEQRFGILRKHCQDVGRPYDAITRTINYWALVARDETEREAKKNRFPDMDFIQTPEETVQSLQQYEAAGTQMAIVKLLDADDLEPVRVFADTVMAAFA